MRLPIPATIAALLAIAFLAPAAGQSSSDFFEKCGDPELTLVFMNPDLRAKSDGYVHASGSFFIQFQARGESAFDIASLKFSEGVEANGVKSCDTPEWVSEGMVLKNYRADYEPRDGFFVPINTCNVPNGQYIAGISVYDKDLKELVRYWTRAKVDNGPGNTKTERCANPDTTAPWPMILPGDGERLDGQPGVYIEVGETLSEIQAWVNGQKIQLTEGLGPERDDDLIVDLGYHPALRDSGLTQAQLEKRRYPAYTWDGVVRDGDIIKVRAVDMWGNVAEKIVHLGDPTIGGRATLAAPDFELQVPETDKVADDNGTAVYNVTYLTKSDEGLHADLYIRNEEGGQQLPKGITYRLNPNHVMMGGNEDLDGSIVLIATPEASVGTYKLLFAANYLAGVERLEKVVPLTFRVETVPGSDVTAQEEFASETAPLAQETVRDGALDSAQTPVPTEEEKKDTPALTVALVLAALAIAGFSRRR